jgi:hypothetical protein
MENAVCLHEQDGGIGWKHTNYRTNVAAVIRARVLVVQTIITVANYEYIFVPYHTPSFSAVLLTCRPGNSDKQQISISKSVQQESCPPNPSISP